MPNLQSIQSVLRAGGYSFSGFLCTPIERVVFSRVVNMPGGIPDQALTLTFDNAYSGAGAYTAVEEDMEIVVHVGNTDAIRGRLRVAPGASTSTVLQINEVSHGRIDIHDNDRIDVLDSYRLRDRLIEAGVQFRKDSRIPYSNQGTDHPPTIVSGPGAVGFVDPLTGLLTVSFDLSQSYPNDTDNLSGVALLSDVADGTITVGVDTDAVFTATFPVGFRWVTIIGADADNGEATVRKLPVWAFDGVTYSPIPIIKYSATLDRKTGDSATFQLGSDCDLSSLPEGALLYYFEREYWFGTEASYGNQVADRSNIKFVGFARRETITIDPNNDTLTFEAIGPLQKAGELPGFTQDLIMTAIPADWQHDEWVSVPKKLVCYLTFWHSTLHLLFDVCFQGSATGDYVYPEFFVQSSNLRAQSEEVTAGVSMSFTCDRTGRFIVARNLQRGNVSERDTAAPVTLALTRRDLKEITSLTWEHSYQYNQLEAKGFSGNGTPLKAVAGGEAPAEAPDLTSFERAIVTIGVPDAQNELIAIASDAFAEVNSLYNGQGVPRGIPFKVPTSYDVVDPAYPEWLATTLPSSSNRRGRSFAGDRFILQRVEIEADAVSGTKQISWTVDHETKGQGAVARAVEDPQPNAPYTPTPYVPLPPATLLFPGLNSGTGNRMALPSANGIAMTGNFQSSLPIWSLPIWSVIGINGTFLHWVPRGSAPGAGWVVTSEEVGYLVLKTLAYTVKHTFATASMSRNVDASFSEDGFLSIASYYRGSGSYSLATTDNFATLVGGGEVLVSAHWVTNSAYDGTPYAVYVSSKVAGKIWAGAFASTADHVAVTSAVYESTDHGATWHLLGSPALTCGTLPPRLLHVPWADNADEQIVYYDVTLSPAPPNNAYLARTMGGSTADISPQVGGLNIIPLLGRNALQTAVGRSSRLLLVGRQQDTGGQFAVLLTNHARDGSLMWMTVEGAGSDARGCAISGDNPNLAWVFGGNGKVAQLTISGDTVTEADKSGNLAALSAGDAESIAGY